MKGDYALWLQSFKFTVDPFVAANGYMVPFLREHLPASLLNHPDHPNDLTVINPRFDRHWDVVCYLATGGIRDRFNLWNDNAYIRYVNDIAESAAGPALVACAIKYMQPDDRWPLKKIIRAPPSDDYPEPYLGLRKVRLLMCTDFVPESYATTDVLDRQWRWGDVPQGSSMSSIPEFWDGTETVSSVTATNIDMFPRETVWPQFPDGTVMYR